MSIAGLVIVDPDGFPLAGPAEPREVRTLVARCRMGDARDKRLRERNDALADRRPELYGALTATGPARRLGQGCRAVAPPHG
jgi:hypothetical protein